MESENRRLPDDPMPHQVPSAESGVDGVQLSVDDVARLVAEPVIPLRAEQVDLLIEEALSHAWWLGEESRREMRTDRSTLLGWVKATIGRSAPLAASVAACVALVVGTLTIGPDALSGLLGGSSEVIVAGGSSESATTSTLAVAGYSTSSVLDSTESESFADAGTPGMAVDDLSTPPESGATTLTDPLSRAEFPEVLSRCVPRSPVTGTTISANRAEPGSITSVPTPVPDRSLWQMVRHLRCIG